MKMTVKNNVDINYFILDIAPVDVSLLSVYENFDMRDVIDNYCFKYIDITGGMLYCPRIQFVFDINDGENVYLEKYGANGFMRVYDNVDIEDVSFDYNINLKIYTAMTKMSFVSNTKDIITIHNNNNNIIPSQLLFRQSDTTFDNYINLDIQNGKVLNLSNCEFFKEIEKIFS